MPQKPAAEPADAKAIAPLKPKLDSFAAIGDRKALVRAIGGEFRADVDALNATGRVAARLVPATGAPDSAPCCPPCREAHVADPPPVETTAQALEALDAHFPRLRGAETRKSLDLEA